MKELNFPHSKFLVGFFPWNCWRLLISLFIGLCRSIKLPSRLRQEIDDTNNMVAECNLSLFDQKSKVAKSKNSKFKAKGIRNEVVHFQSHPTTL